MCVSLSGVLFLAHAQSDTDQKLARVIHLKSIEGEIILRTLIPFCIVGLLCCSLNGALAGTIYKSVTPDGRVVFSDQQPREGRLEKVMQFKDQPASDIPASTLSEIERLKKAAANPATDSAIASKDLILYSASWCGYCKKAKSYLAVKGISYREVDIDTNYGKVGFAEVRGGRGVPLMLSGTKRMQGFSKEGYDAFFANRD